MEAETEADWPVISLVTPSFNQCQFIRETLDSVLNQKYPRLQYVVVDGGSTDGTVEILRECAPRLHWWTSERDSGPEEALNKGFAHTTGEIMAWIGSSDHFLPGSLRTVGEIFRKFPEVEWLTTLFPLNQDEARTSFSCFRMPGYHHDGFFSAEYLNMGGPWWARGWIQAESTFWRRSLWDRTGGYLRTGTTASDFDLWARFYRKATLHGVEASLGVFRNHPGQRGLGKRNAYLQDALQVIKEHGGWPHSRVDSFVRVKMMARFPMWLLPGVVKRKLLPVAPCFTYTGRQHGWLQEERAIVGGYQKKACNNIMHYSDEIFSTSDS